MVFDKIKMTILLSLMIFTINNEVESGISNELKSIDESVKSSEKEVYSKFNDYLFEGDLKVIGGKIFLDKENMKEMVEINYKDFNKVTNSNKRSYNENSKYDIDSSLYDIYYFEKDNNYYKLAKKRYIDDYYIDTIIIKNKEDYKRIKESKTAEIENIQEIKLNNSNILRLKNEIIIEVKESYYKYKNEVFYGYDVGGYEKERLSTLKNILYVSFIPVFILIVVLGRIKKVNRTLKKDNNKNVFFMKKENQRNKNKELISKLRQEKPLKKERAEKEHKIEEKFKVEIKND